MKSIIFVISLILLAMVASSCGSTEDSVVNRGTREARAALRTEIALSATSTEVPRTNTPWPTNPPLPTSTPLPTDTPLPPVVVTAEALGFGLRSSWQLSTRERRLFFGGAVMEMVKGQELAEGLGFTTQRQMANLLADDVLFVQQTWAAGLTVVGTSLLEEFENWEHVLDVLEQMLEEYEAEDLMQILAENFPGRFRTYEPALRALYPGLLPETVAVTANVVTATEFLTVMATATATATLGFRPVDIPTTGG